MQQSASLNLLLDDLEDQGRINDPTEVFSAFTEWAEAGGRPLYPHQAESALEIFSDNHVIATTPTGSGKSLIALAGHLHALAKGERSYYTAPLKALVSEKFFDLVGYFGAENVGMVTGDVSVNAEAPIICATAEILANQALREGNDLDVGCVIMDEFHYYGDPQRGVAWQIPLLELPQAQMVLLSATLGDVSFFVKDLTTRTNRDVAVISDAKRPVPLEMSYTLEATDELIKRLLSEDRYPIYLVHFSQKEALSAANNLLSTPLLNKEQKEAIANELATVKFAPGFGKILNKLLRHGIGIHHAGMLPRYRRLVERLTQQGLLAVVCGTDTLGVGINVPIRTVVFTALTKFDGRRERHLQAREFHQIAGRAGRAGFDTVGYVYAQAPADKIEAHKREQKAEANGKKAKKTVKSNKTDNRVSWTEATFERLCQAEPEKLVSRFTFTHSMFLSVLERKGDPEAHLLKLATDNHDQWHGNNPHLRTLGQIYQSLLTAEVIDYHHEQRNEGAIIDIEVSNDKDEKYPLRFARDIPADFALNQPLSPFALAAMDLLNPDDPSFSLDVISIIEATLEDPRPLLYAQQNEARSTAINEMKAAGWDYDQRMAALEEITWPKPLEDLLDPAFSMFAKANPWVSDEELKPKSVVRYLVENAMTFSELIAHYQIPGAEGVILRYLTDAYRACRQVIPPEYSTDEVQRIVDWLGQLVRSVDSSLLDEWDALASGTAPSTSESADENQELAFGANENGEVPFSANPHKFGKEIRNLLFDLITKMSADRVEKLGDLAIAGWSDDDWDLVLGRYFQDHEEIIIDQEARSATYFEWQRKLETADLLKLWSDLEGIQVGNYELAIQTIVDEDGDYDWAIWALIDREASNEQQRVVVSKLKVATR
ncbi:DEAD/DEAH box helicase [Boudabousia tangfeifanii]|uniref:DEAD/DEAH box helicase n=1 Tax=Boudabousia tangfeifanii TaxID=1912795 RepID=A0A1D9MJB7_9ACTO|nr:DUF3516 domain-containing protein [Boudabousia tangfeifanii]AOZ72382.1 DEAD/DEAH box helicase [Boudabousia tangfeifanii]